MEPSERAALLAKVLLFESLPQSELEHLAETLQPREFAQGALMIQEGDTDEHIYILLEGEAEVIKALGTPDERQLAIRPSGSLFGEMSLFASQGSHTASVRAHTPTHVLEMTRQDLDALLHRYPSLVYDMTRQISRHLEDSENATILDLREKNAQLTRAYQELKAAQEHLVAEERLKKELEIAHQIQLTFLPQSLPEFPGWELAATWKTARQVGGDFYDVFELPGRKLGLIIADVSDKGVPAALFMALTRTLMRAVVYDTASPAEALRRVNALMIPDNLQSMFVTVVYGVLSLESGEFIYANAGHPPPLWLCRDDETIETLNRTGVVLGLLEDLVMEDRTITIHPGNCLLLYTDGVTEAFSPEEELYGEERLRQIFQGRLADSARGLLDMIESSVDQFMGPLPPSDDITMLAIHRLE